MATAIDDVLADLEGLEQDPALCVEENFAARAEALDAIESDLLERIEGMQGAGDETEAVQVLRRRAEALRGSLEDANRHLFEKLRDGIRAGNLQGAELARRLRAYAGYDKGDGHRAEIGYDSLDALISGLLLTSPAPVETQARAPDMVFYQPTPARIMLDLVASVPLSTRDIFCDLGSGLGQVVILVHLLTGVRAYGIEYEPAYCDYAQRCAQDLGLSQVEFIIGDARAADLSEGSVFYMYTPFGGEMLASVLRRLERLARAARPIRLLTYGPCTLEVGRQDWLTCEDAAGLDPEHLAVFHS